MKGGRGRKSREEGHPYFLSLFLPFNKAPVFSVPFQTTKSFLSAPEGIRVGQSKVWERKRELIVQTMVRASSRLTEQKWQTEARTSQPLRNKGPASGWDG